MYSIVGENFSWMAYNILLAVIPVLLAQLFFRSKSAFMKVILFIAWLFFVPNTIYLFTDFLHFVEQINEMDFLGAAFLTVQYAALFIAGFLTYILSVYPVERKLKLSSSVIIGINLIIGFGMVIGRVHRLNSWDVIVQTGKVVNTTLETITSPKLFLLAILFGLFANFMYFLTRKKVVKYVSRIKKRI